MKAKVIMERIVLKIDGKKKSYQKGDIVELDEASMKAWEKAGIVEACKVEEAPAIPKAKGPSNQDIEDKFIKEQVEVVSKKEEFTPPVKRRNKRKA